MTTIKYSWRHCLQIPVHQSLFCPYSHLLPKCLCRGGIWEDGYWEGRSESRRPEAKLWCSCSKILHWMLLQTIFRSGMWCSLQLSHQPRHSFWFQRGTVPEGDKILTVGGQPMEIWSQLGVGQRRCSGSAICCGFGRLIREQLPSHHFWWDFFNLSSFDSVWSISHRWRCWRNTPSLSARCRH